MINICQAIGSTETENHVVISTKTENSTRVIPYREELDIIFDELKDKEFLFKRDNGKFLIGSYISDILRKHTKGKIRTYMLKQNIDIRTIQDIMGHSSQVMTLEYARSNKDDMREAMDKR